MRRFLESVLGIFVQERQLGKLFSENFPVKLSERHWREPDITFVATDRLVYLEKTVFRGPPNLIIELTSEESRYRDTIVKRAEYEELGVNEYWIMDPDDRKKSIFLELRGKKFEAKIPREGRLNSSAVEGFFLRQEWIWPEGELPKINDVQRELNLI